MIYKRPTFGFTDLDVALDAVIAECEARECKCDPMLCDERTRWIELGYGDSHWSYIA